MTTRNELLALAANHEAEIVGGNVQARVGGQLVWLGKMTEGVFTLTDEGVHFVQEAREEADAEAAPLPKPRARAKPKAAAAPAETEAPTLDDVLGE